MRNETEFTRRLRQKQEDSDFRAHNNALKELTKPRMAYPNTTADGKEMPPHRADKPDRGVNRKQAKRMKVRFMKATGHRKGDNNPVEYVGAV